MATKPKAEIVLTEPISAEAAKAIERVLIMGDLSKLTEEQRVDYYLTTCKSLGLNPLTKPFLYLILNGKMVLYATRDCTDQLRKINGVSVTELLESTQENVFIIKAKGMDKTGRTDAATGAVNIGGLKGDSLANAIMKAETKAKRRLTLSICGLGMLDETEVESIPGASIVEANVTQTVTDPKPAPVKTAKPTPPPKATIPVEAPTKPPVPKETPKAPAPVKAAAPKSRKERGREIANKTGCSTTNLTSFIGKTLGLNSTEEYKTVPPSRFEAVIWSLEQTLEKFPRGAGLIKALICDEAGVDASVKSYFHMAFSKAEAN